MAKPNSKIYTCSKCDAQHPKWSGRCESCGAWGTLNEEITSNNQGGAIFKAAPIISGANIKQTSEPKRLTTSIEEIDRVFGGGLVPGSLTLIGGEPGIGKSTIVAQIANALTSSAKIIYVSGEESASQIGMRLSRLNCDLTKIDFITDTEINSIIAAVMNQPPDLLIVDSIQTVYTASETGEAGGIAQIRAVTVKLLELAKQQNIATLIIGHITKDGQVAGPKTLEHLVDTVIYLEADSSHNYRLLRTSKNRFGATSEVGIFEMTGGGLKAVDNPVGLFLETANADTSGTAITCVSEGARNFLIEVQSLVAKTAFGYPQRRASGFDANRLQVLSAVLMKRARLNTANYDIILNIVGGLKITDPALDLAVCLSIVSSLKDQPINRQTIIIGEVGLGGEIRPIPKLESRLKEAAKMGFKKAIVPPTDLKISGLEIITVTTLSAALEKI